MPTLQPSFIIFLEEIKLIMNSSATKGISESWKESGVSDKRNGQTALSFCFAHSDFPCLNTCGGQYVLRNIEAFI